MKVNLDAPKANYIAKINFGGAVPDVDGIGVWLVSETRHPL